MGFPPSNNPVPVTCILSNGEKLEAEYAKEPRLYAALQELSALQEQLGQILEILPHVGKTCRYWKTGKCNVDYGVCVADYLCPNRKWEAKTKFRAQVSNTQVCTFHAERIANLITCYHDDPLKSAYCLMRRPSCGWWGKLEMGTDKDAE